MKRFFFIFLILLVISCSKAPAQIPSNHFIPGIALPLRLDKNQTQILVSDFVPEVAVIDSVYLDGRKVALSADKNTVEFNIPADANPLMELKFWSKGSFQSVLVMKSRKVDFAYTYNPGDKTYSSVQLSGEFNGWTPSRTPLKFENGNWKFESGSEGMPLAKVEIWLSLNRYVTYCFIIRRSP